MKRLWTRCGMTIKQAAAATTSAYQGQTHYFCAPGCKAACDKEPAKYLASPGPAGSR